MARTPDARHGTIAWVDLTVPDAPALRDFYSAVTGWVPEALSMGAYDDYVMKAPRSGTATAGVCHARGGNASLPSQWLVYIIVDDLDARLAACRTRGGDVIAGPTSMGGTARYAVIRDPVGAVAALYEGAVPGAAESASKPERSKRPAANRTKSRKSAPARTRRKPTARTRSPARSKRKRSARRK